MASYIKRTIRLNPSQARSLSGIADRRGLSEYAMLLKVIDAGFLSVLHGTDKDTDLAELAREIGSISERLAEAERVLGTKKSDETIAAEARAAFERQHSLALEIEP